MAYKKQGENDELLFIHWKLLFRLTFLVALADGLPIYYIVDVVRSLFIAVLIIKWAHLLCFHDSAAHLRASLNMVGMVRIFNVNCPFKAPALLVTKTLNCRLLSVHIPTIQ